MPISTESTSEVLEDHIPEEESVRGVYHGTDNDGWNRTVAVTDRRLMEITQSQGATEENTEADSALLTGEHVTGLRYGREEEEEPATGQRLIGAILAAVGLLISLAGLGELSGPTGGPGLLLLGIIVAVAGYAIYRAAEDVEYGDVALSLERANVPNKHYKLPRGHVEVPREASKVLAKRHAD